MIRLGLIGCGVVASYGHIPAILDTPGLTLESIMDVDPAPLLEMQARFGIKKTFTDLDLFFQSGIDAVIICSPAPAHFHHVQTAARYRKPALCEKPLAMTEAEAREMVGIMVDAGLPLYVGFTYRFAPVALDIHRLVRENAIGDVRSLRLAYVWDCHGKYVDRDPALGIYDRRHVRMLEGGPMVDCGVHQIDLARWWTGSEIDRVLGVGAWVETEGYEAPDHLFLHADHRNGCHTQVEISFTYGHTSKEPRCDFWYELIGTDGLIRYNRQQRIFECVNSRGSRKLKWTEEKNFHGMYTELEHAMRTGDSRNMPTAVDGVTATRIARLATESAIAWRRADAKP
jgi:predicted dehydrogenase